MRQDGITPPSVPNYVSASLNCRVTSIPLLPLRKPWGLNRVYLVNDSLVKGRRDCERGLSILVWRRIEVMERRGGRCKRLLYDLRERRWYWKLRGSTRSHSVENSIWKKLWKYRKTVFYIYCSVHHNILLEITKRWNCTQWILFLCLVHSTYSGRHTRPSSEVQLYLQPLVQS